MNEKKNSFLQDLEDVFDISHSRTFSSIGAVEKKILSDSFNEIRQQVKIITESQKCTGIQQKCSYNDLKLKITLVP